MNESAQKYSIVWSELPNGWAGQKQVGKAPLRVPYLLTSREYLAYNNGCAVTLTDKMFAQGALHEWLASTDQWRVSDHDALRSFLRAFLVRFSVRGGYGSLSALLLTLATKAREAHGVVASMKMLVAAHHLLPNDVDIRSDLLLDVWRVTELNEAVDRTTAYGLIRYLYDGIRFDQMSEDVCDELDYANFVALSHFGDFQRRNWLFWRVISKRIRHKQLKHKMIQLLNRRASSVAANGNFPAHARAS